MRLVLLPSLVLVACATTHPADPLPCSDRDPTRCLQFVALVQTSTQEGGSLSLALERYCLEGSLESCQQLAKLRRDPSLDRLCQDGIAEACPIPNDKRAPEVLRAECDQGLPQACRTYLARAGYDGASPATLERGCTEGVAWACFALSKRLDASQADRAKKLVWRACLAGVASACLESDVGASKCAQGNASACKAFRLAEGDEPETVARKVSVLKQACAHKLPEACQSLAATLPHAELLTLACATGETCFAALGELKNDELEPLCRDGQGLIRELSCTQLSEDRWDAKEAPAFLTTWARARCDEAKGETRQARCRAWERVLQDAERRLELERLRCSMDSCDSKDSLTALDRCLSGEKGEICARAGLWLKSLRLVHPEETSVELKVMSLACESNEALSCLEAARLQDGDPQARLTLYERACRAGSKEGCTEASTLSLARRACDQNHCRDWALAMGQTRRSYFSLRDDMPQAGVALLAKTCALGTMEDCAAWAGVSSASTRLRQCIERPAFCPPFAGKDKAEIALMKSLRPKLTALLKGCDAGDGKACSDLLALMSTTGYFEPGLSQNDPEVVKWATQACDAGGSCVTLVSLLAEQSPETPALATALHVARGKACAQGNGRQCGELARVAWDEAREQSAGTLDRMSPVLKSALAAALKGCDLGDRDSCLTAADFVESGVGVAADELQAERLRAKARDTVR